MKKLLLIASILVLLISCEQGSYEDSIVNENSFTTIEKQLLPKDTVIVSFDETDVYFFRDNIIVARAAFYGNDEVDMVTVGGMFILIMVALIIGMILGAVISS